jgi:hypothetical protein
MIVEGKLQANKIVRFQRRNVYLSQISTHLRLIASSQLFLLSRNFSQNEIHRDAWFGIELYSRDHLFHHSPGSTVVRILLL